MNTTDFLSWEVLCWEVRKEAPTWVCRELALKVQEHQRRYNAFLKRLRQARLDANLRQEDVRRMIGVYQSYMSKIESGERRLDVIELKELAAIYKKPIEYFLR